MRISNGTEIAVAGAGQRDLPVAVARATAVAKVPQPRIPRWSDQPDASRLRGLVVDLLV